MNSPPTSTTTRFAYDSEFGGRWLLRVRMEEPETGGACRAYVSVQRHQGATREPRGMNYLISKLKPESFQAMPS